MISQANSDPTRNAEKAFARGDWGAAAEGYLEGLDAGWHDDGRRLKLAISLIRVGRLASGLQHLRVLNALADRDTALLRQNAIAPLIHDSNLEAAAEVLAIIVERCPKDVSALATLASVLGRLSRLEEARCCLEKCTRLAPNDPSIAAQSIQILLRLGETDRAADHARAKKSLWTSDGRLAGIATIALERDGDIEAASESGHVTAELEPNNAAFVAPAMRAMLKMGKLDLAKRLGEHCLHLGGDTVGLRNAFAQILMARDADDLEVEPHLATALEHDPSNIRSNQLLAKILLRSGRHEDAIVRLERAAQAAPNSPNLKVELANALSAAGRHGEAAEMMAVVTRMRPDEAVWQRMAAGMFSRAGREREAEEIYANSVRLREIRLPARLADGLAQLWERTEEADLPRARLDWAWGLTVKYTPAEKLPERTQWEREAAWGHLADNLILDWLECRTERAEEIAELCDDLSQIAQSLRNALDQGNGVLLASAHIGAMFAGPVLLATSGLPFQWLASTPGLKSLRYADTLISTSDQSPQRVAAKAMRALRQQNVVTIALDGSTDHTAPRIPFEGKRIAYTDFGSRAVMRTSAQSFFVAPYWRDNRIRVTLTALPMIAAGQDFGEFSAAWNTAYFDCIRSCFSQGGRNLRLNGGFWRFV